MALLPVRHPQADFFILDIADVVPKDDTASMEHPLFSLATKPDMRHLEYRSGDNVLKIRPSGIGLPTIKDKDVLIYCVSQLMHLKNQGKPIGKRVRFSAREMCIATNRPISGESYQRLEDAFARLQGAQFITNIRSGGKITTKIFGLVDEAGFVRREDNFRVDHCEVVLSDWYMNAIEAGAVRSIDGLYFRVRRPLERRLYEIGLKHLWKKKKWHIYLDKLQSKTGSNAPLKKFRMNLREIIEADDTPEIYFQLAENDLVTVRPRNPKTAFSETILLPEWSEEKSRKIARDLGYDYYALRREWLEFARQGEPPKNAGAAFVGFCKKKKPLR